MTHEVDRRISLFEAGTSMKLPLPGLFVAVWAIAVTGCGDKCHNEQVSVAPSPSGQFRAIVFHRNCGPTTERNTQVAVLPKSAQLANIPGNTLIVGGDIPLKVRWDSETALTVSGLGSARVFKQNKTAADVTISYAK
ncbi:hypothetical protein MNR01_13320 [Lysobacter sp. S4-A87]|uniref:hypothetical protein n=1 Tax=Lysobacter sp. S4-A87 TaxID=2925843 RepID=UPI001F533C5D|nr:hypothetical protein [Lysobacter sp. S4-A87]UNK48716.1 hypothetical protein MNR01_13320 [Lysobacter sp. S4-A87]